MSAWQIAETWRGVLGWSRLDDALDDPAVAVWRDIPERTNGTLDTPRGRVHVKRLKPGFGGEAQREAEGIRLLTEAGVPTVELVAHGWNADTGRGVVVVTDLAGYVPADEWLGDGAAFGDLLEPTADVAGQLHAAGLQHRDLYLNHFLYNGSDVRLIDAARVQRRPWWRNRGGVVKDLAQFLYSTRHHDRISDTDRRDWFDRWQERSGVGVPRAWVLAKVRRIATHDTKLADRQPGRHVRLNELQPADAARRDG